MKPAHQSSALRRAYNIIAILFTIALIPAPYLLVFAAVFWHQAGVINRRNHIDQRIAAQRAHRYACEEQRRREDQLIRAARSLR